MAEFNIDDIQQKIGYTFQNPTLLKQAFTTPSVTVASKRKIQNYQVLEFIGDAVLDLAVVKNLVSEFCKIDSDGQMVSKTNEGKLTTRKQDFVKNETLYHCAKAIGLNKYINKAYGFCSYNHKTKKGDLIEAILGAVALDSNWNMEVLSEVTKEIFNQKNVKTARKNAIRENKNLSPVTKVDNLYAMHEISKPIYNFEKLQNGLHGVWKCSVTLLETEHKFFAEDNKLKVAKRISAQKLVDYLSGKVTEPNVIDESNGEKLAKGQGLLKLIISKYI